MKRRVLLTAQDPGAGAFLRPLARALTLEFGDVRVAVSELNLASYASLPGVQILEATLSESRVAQLLEGVSHLVTGTSWGSMSEQGLRKAAAVQGIPVFIGIDSWSNHRDRFPEGASEVGNKSAKLWVVDGAMQSELIDFGFSSQQVHVVGHPSWDEIASQPRSSSSETDGVLFLSEPFRQEGPDPRRGVWDAVTEALEQDASGRVTKVWLKPHPKETLSSLPNSTRHVHWEWAKPGIIRPRLVFGFQTMGLAEWKLRGVRAVGIPFLKTGSSGLFRAFEALGVEWVAPCEEGSMASKVSEVLSRKEPSLGYAPSHSVQKMMKDLRA